MNFAKIPFKSTIHIYRGSSTRSFTLLQKLDSWQKEKNERSCTGGMYTLVQKEDKHFLHIGSCAICLDKKCQWSTSNYRNKEIEEDESSSLLTTWANCKGPNLLVRNAETNFGRHSLSHHYVPVYTLEECVVKVVKENREENCSQDNLRLERTRCNTPKYFEGTRIPTFQAYHGKPRVICTRGTWTQFHQRVAIGQTRIYKDKQYI